jgi:hypothetical protein
MSRFSDSVPVIYTNEHGQEAAVDAGQRLGEQVLAAGQSEGRKPGGSTREVHNKSNGTDVVLDGQGRVLKITRSDGTGVECAYKGNQVVQIVEHRAGGKRVEWNRDGATDNWRTMEFIGATRLHFRAHPDGSITYGGMNGTEYTIYGDGSQLRITEHRARIGIDRDGNITNVQRADGTDITCAYTGKRLDHIVETRGGQSVVWERQPDDTWTSRQTNEVRRNFAVSDLGNTAYVTSLNNTVLHIDYLDGNQRDFQWNNGKMQQVVERTARGVVTWQRQGNSDEWANGQTREIRRDVQAGLDGSYSYVNNAGRKHIHNFDDTETQLLAVDVALTAPVKAAHDALLAAAGKQITDSTAMQQFVKDLDRFERRAATDGLPEQKVIASLEGIRRLMELPAQSAVLSQDERNRLARELMHHAAIPRSVDQGDHNTCGAAVIQVITAAVDPDKMIDLVRQVAENGKFVSPKQGGQTVVVDQAACIQIGRPAITNSSTMKAASAASPASSSRLSA